MTAPTSNDDDDLFTLTMMTLGWLGAASAAVVGAGTDAWTAAVTWMLTHHVLVRASAGPLLPVPHAGGAGLDLPRMSVVAALALLLLAAASAMRRHRRSQIGDPR